MNRAYMIALTATMFLGIAGAQTSPQETAGLVQNATETSLQLRDTQGTLQAALISGDVTTGLSTATLQKSGTWFSSFHPRSSLTEVSSYYLNALTRLGFTGADDSVSKEVGIWTFVKDGRRVSAVFNRRGDGVVANISWL